MQIANRDVLSLFIIAQLAAFPCNLCWKLHSEKTSFCFTLFLFSSVNCRLWMLFHVSFCRLEKTLCTKIHNRTWWNLMLCFVLYCDLCALFYHFIAFISLWMSVILCTRNHFFSIGLPALFCKHKNDFSAGKGRVMAALLLPVIIACISYLSAMCAILQILPELWSHFRHFLKSFWLKSCFKSIQFEYFMKKAKYNNRFCHLKTLKKFSILNGII